MRNQGINYNHLYTFYLVAKSNSMGDAADVLGVSKPGLSVQIKKLEENLGLQLFNRSEKALKLTHHGIKVQSYASKMFEYSDAMIRSLSIEKTSGKERVTIGITPGISRFYAVKALVPVLKSEKLIPKIKEGSFDYLQNGLSRGEVDLILSEEQSLSKEINGLSRTIIGKNNYVFVCSRKLKDLKKNFPQSLNNCELFTFSETNPVRVKIDSFCFLHKLKLNFFGECDGIEFIKKAVEAGLCIAALPMWFIEEEIKNGELFLLGDLAGENEDLIVTHRNNDNLSRIEEVVRLLKKPKL